MQLFKIKKKLMSPKYHPVQVVYTLEGSQKSDGVGEPSGLIPTSLYAPVSGVILEISSSVAGSETEVSGEKTLGSDTPARPMAVPEYRIMN